MLVVRLITKLDLLCSSGAASGVDDTEPTAAYAHSILRTISDALATKVEKGHMDVPKYIDRLLPRLYHLHIYSALTPGEDTVGTVAADARLVAVSAEIVTLIVQSENAQYVLAFSLGMNWNLMISISCQETGELCFSLIFCVP